MEKYITWYTLLLKAWLKRKTSWLLLAGICMIILLVSQIHLPSANNINVGIASSNDEYGQKMMEALKEMDSIFTFVEYDNAKKLTKDVEAGRLECGFILEEDFQERIQKDDLKDIVTYVCTPQTTKGEVVKETVYAAFLQVYGEEILIDNEETVFGRKNEAITSMLLEEYQHNLKNSRLLEMKTEIVSADNMESVAEETADVLPVQGIAGALLFLMLWFEAGRKFEKSGSYVYAALDMQNRNIFEYCGYLAAVTIPAVITVLLILLLGQGRSVWKEMLAMMVFVFIGCLWILAVGKLFKKSTTFLSWAMTIVLIQALICPVFVDLAVYFPALGLIRKIFPLEWYLQI
ncbi:MAG: hypothetical protein J5983_02285 [Ruminococcus sp.]|nr:hypothetical protein [Ruminococcus sp.]